MTSSEYEAEIAELGEVIERMMIQRLWMQDRISKLEQQLKEASDAAHPHDGA